MTHEEMLEEAARREAHNQEDPMTISVDWPEDSDTLTIHWDENDPTESMFNDWTEEDFLTLFRERATDTILSYEPDSSEEWSEEGGTHS